jgi:putative membrane protein
MGLANLVPGISGGTMLVATGIYRRFIDAVSDVTRLRFRRESILTLAIVGGVALTAFVLLAGVVRDLVVDYRWVMYSLFIGLTLGGVPVVMRMARDSDGGVNRSVRVGMVAGFVGMAAVAWAQMSGGASGATDASMVLLFFGGAAAASAMILPGVSGGYLLLVLGVYVPVLTAVHDRDFAVIIPFGLGVGAGVAAVSNVLRYLLHRYEKATLGVLIGLLLGAVIGLWPYQAGVKPNVGDVVKGQALTEETLAELKPKDWPTEFFRPGATHIAGALGLILAGLGITAGVARLSRQKDPAIQRESTS